MVLLVNGNMISRLKNEICLKLILMQSYILVKLERLLLYNTWRECILNMDQRKPLKSAFNNQ